MIKEDYIKLHKLLSEIYDEYNSESYEMKYGSNKSIRSKAERNANNLRKRAFNYINRYPKSIDLMINENSTAMDKAILMDEFNTSTWFDSDMSEFLDKIDEKIKLME